MQNRIKTALEFLKDGQSFKIGDLRLSINEQNCLVISSWSRYINFRNLTMPKSLEELDEIKSLYNEMELLSDELKHFVESRCKEFVLCYDDGGKSSIEICSEREGIIEWKLELD